MSQQNDVAAASSKGGIVVEFGGRSGSGGGDAYWNESDFAYPLLYNSVQADDVPSEVGSRHPASDAKGSSAAGKESAERKSSSIANSAVNSKNSGEQVEEEDDIDDAVSVLTDKS